ncbi:MAG: ATP-dependent zinc metalloprotease FtsH [Trueperaceae bacterium]|nr:MAG: ATP-dependent zinc metalloprotease FtsH [Trueperaceae bacterium]
MGQLPIRGFLIAVVIIGLVVFIASQSNNRNRGEVKSFSYFQQQVAAERVASIRVKDTELQVTPKGGDPFVTHLPSPPQDLSIYSSQGIEVEVVPRGQNWNSLVFYLIPVLLMVGFLFYLMRGVRSGGDGAVSFGKSRARLVTEESSNVLFKDVAGVEEAKNDLTEVVEFLKSPGKFHALGARIPHGVLMVGPPGSGKTHLAKAVAGEAKVPFFSISGSDFVEMFVGVGAARVRDLFENAKKNAPCIVFIDEIDAVGRRRGVSMNGGNDEREQTLNALLVEMDGFESQHDIIIIAATNRPDVLDPALLRPGRFDRQVVVDAPDVRGREAILRIHARNKPLASTVDLHTVAKRTPGFVGADLENLLNEAALVAARNNRREINSKDLDDAADRVIMGPERRSRVISDWEKRVTAYHEAGHALAAEMLERADPVHKITIVPRGRAMGYVMQFPEEDRMSASRLALLDRIAVALAGRATEELIFGDVTTGAQNDFQQATDIARRMVTRWGMSSNLGKIALSSGADSYLGEFEGMRSYSEETAKLIDIEVKDIIDEQYQRVLALLEKNRELVESVVSVLLERETLHADEFEIVMKGEVLPELEPENPEEPPQRSAAQAPAPGEEKSQEQRLPPGMMPKPG